MKSDRLKLGQLVRASTAAARASYREAVASSIDGTGAEEAWAKFRRITGRSIVLARLIGVAGTVAFAQRNGAEFDFTDDAELDLPDQFDRERPEYEVELTFHVGPFEEAVELFRGRVPRLKSTVNRLAADAHRLSATIAGGERAKAAAAVTRAESIQSAIRASFWASGVGEKKIVDLKKLVGDAIRGVEPEPTSIPTFIDRARLIGVRNLTDARLETVYRNNLTGAFNQAQVEILAAPAVRQTAPLAMIREIHDSRTRGNPSGLHPQGKHWQMDGYVNTPEEIIRQGLTPPNGHNCRGAIVPVTWRQAEQMGFIVNGIVDFVRVAAHNGARQGIIDRGEYPDPGFKN